MHKEYKLHKEEKFIEVIFLKKKIKEEYIEQIYNNWQEKNTILNMKFVDILDYNIIEKIEKWQTIILKNNKSFKICCANKILTCKLNKFEMLNTKYEAIDLIFMEEIEREIKKKKT